MSLFVLSILLGMGHALEADHLLSISAMINGKMSVKKITFLGLFWGLGHTVTLLLITAGVIFFNLILSDWVNNILEFFVGILLVVLGIDVLRRMRKNKVYFHVHQHHDGKVHFHAHTHSSNDYPRQEEMSSNNEIPFHADPFGFFGRIKPFLVGLLHGAAGSSAFLALALIVAKNNFTKLLYVFFFGIGSLIGMAAITLTLSWPIKKISGMTHKKFTRFYRFMAYGLSLTTIVFGLFIIIRSGNVLF